MWTLDGAGGGGGGGRDHGLLHGEAGRRAAAARRRGHRTGVGGRGRVAGGGAAGRGAGAGLGGLGPGAVGPHLGLGRGHHLRLLLLRGGRESPGLGQLLITFRVKVKTGLGCLCVARAGGRRAITVYHTGRTLGGLSGQGAAWSAGGHHLRGLGRRFTRVGRGCSRLCRGPANLTSGRGRLLAWLRGRGRGGVLLVREVDTGPAAPLQRLSRLHFYNFKFSFEVLRPHRDGALLAGGGQAQLAAALHGVVDGHGAADGLVQVGHRVEGVAGLVERHKPEPGVRI